MADRLRVIAALGPWQPLEVGLVEQLHQLLIRPIRQTSDHTQYVRNPLFAFANSQNALEDILGLSSALSLSRATTTGSSEQVTHLGRAAVANTRAGTGQAWALVCMIPPLVSTVILLWLIAATKKPAPLGATRLTDSAVLLLSDRDDNIYR